MAGSSYGCAFLNFVITFLTLSILHTASNFSSSTYFNLLVFPIYGLA